jgi:uncharacterized protein YegJ (DUF2314 family)
VLGGYNEKEMYDAITQARNEVDFFISEFTKGNGTGFAVKAPIKDQGETEHFWVIDIAYQNGVFEGTIGNDPGVVKNVKVGQKWAIRKSEISDWVFMREGKMHGNYTIRPLLKTMPEEESAQIRAILANP